jgi:hypothetical protein
MSVHVITGCAGWAAGGGVGVAGECVTVFCCVSGVAVLSASWEKLGGACSGKCLSGPCAC